jgi:hypothetical protein
VSRQNANQVTLTVTCPHTGQRSTRVDRDLGILPALGKMCDLLVRCDECFRDLDRSTKTLLEDQR